MWKFAWIWHTFPPSSFLLKHMNTYQACCRYGCHLADLGQIGRQRIPFSTGSSAQNPQWKVQQVTQPYSKALREATDTKFASVEEWLRWSKLPPKKIISACIWLRTAVSRELAQGSSRSIAHSMRLNLIMIPLDQKGFIVRLHVKLQSV